MNPFPILVGTVVGTFSGLAAYGIAGGQNWPHMIPVCFVMALLGSCGSDWFLSRRMN